MGGFWLSECENGRTKGDAEGEKLRFFNAKKKIPWQRGAANEEKWGRKSESIKGLLPRVTGDAAIKLANAAPVL